MSSADDIASGPLVAVALAVRTRGLKGEIVAELLTDFPERFENTAKLVAVAPDQKRFLLELEDYWFQRDRVVLKLKGYDDVDAAATLVGYEFAVPETERVPLEAGSYYEWELHGCRVETLSGEFIGSVKEVLRTGGVAMLTVIDKDAREYLIPMAESIVVEIDVANKRIRVDPPAGLLDL